MNRVYQIAIRYVDPEHGATSLGFEALTWGWAKEWVNFERSDGVRLSFPAARIVYIEIDPG